MSKHIVSIPLSDIDRIAIVFGEGRYLAQVKGDADYIINCGFYNMTTGKPVGHLKANNQVYAKESRSRWGYTWDNGNDIRMDVIPDKGGKNYFNGVELLSPGRSIDDELKYNAEVGGYRQRSAIALTEDSLVLYCADSPTTPETLRDELHCLGAVSALMLDGGGSSQCDFMGKKINSSRRVHNYLAVWLKKTEPKGETDMKKVVLDPGHGVETAGKCSPDKSYYEHEFNLDMAKRIKAHLERHGVEVTMTRTDEHETGKTENEALAARVAISNKVRPDLFVSIHSNAYGNGAEWTTPEGYGIYTSSAGDSAGRNIAAKKILARVKEAGITLHGGGMHHSRFYVLRNTIDPAVLIEHGFHTNKAETELLKSSAYRDKLAKADTKGILDYLGIAWKDEPVEPKKLYRVQVGAYSVYNNAVAQLERVKKAGFTDAFITEAEG